MRPQSPLEAEDPKAFDEQELDTDIPVRELLSHVCKRRYLKKERD